MQQREDISQAAFRRKRMRYGQAGGVCRLASVALVVLALFGMASCGKKIISGTEPEKPLTSSGIVATAKSQIGTKYKYGGTSPAIGFDCSGFVSWVYSRHGVSLPRITKEQAKIGKSVPKGKMLPGDIVVFTISRSQGMHTGIYAGKGKFIHSPGTGKLVCEESIDAPYWSSRFIAARRVL